MWELKGIEGISFGIYPGDVFYLDMGKIEQNTCTIKKEDNGYGDTTWTTREIGNKLEITYVGLKSVSQEKTELVFFAEPIFNVPLFGATGLINSSNILDKIARLLFVPGIIYARSIRLEDYLNLINREGKIPIIEKRTSPLQRDESALSRVCCQHSMRMVIMNRHRNSVSRLLIP